MPPEPRTQATPPTSSSAATTRTGTKRRPGGRSAKVQAAVFKATRELLQTTIYEDITIAEIAVQAGIHETSIYRRWQTKEGLIIAVLLEEAKSLFPIPDTGAVRSDLVQWLQAVWAYLQTPFGESVTKMTAITLHHPAMYPERQRYWQQRLAEFKQIVVRAQARGELPPQTDERLLLEMCIGPLHVQRFLLQQEPDDSLPERIVDVVLNGASSPEKTSSPLSFPHHPLP